MNARRNIIRICLFCDGKFFVFTAHIFIDPYLDTHFLLFKNIQSSANVFFGSNILKDNIRVCNGDFGIFIPTFRFTSILDDFYILIQSSERMLIVVRWNLFHYLKKGWSIWP
jgi:hypothetical protein